MNLLYIPTIFICSIDRLDIYTDIQLERCEKTLLKRRSRLLFSSLNERKPIIFEISVEREESEIRHVA